MDSRLGGQVALVTGGGKGIGLGIAQALTAAGVKVVISGRHPDVLAQALKSLGPDSKSLQMDVRNEDSVQSGVRDVVEWAGRLDILVNNAGIGLLQTPLWETSTDQWTDIIETNLTGIYYVTKASWTHLAESKGQVMNVSSIAGTQGFHGASAYCASKFGVNGLTEVFKQEGAGLGIRALSLCPGPVATDIWGDWANDDEKSRMMTPAQLGEVALSLLAAPRNIDLSKLVVINAVSPWTN